MLALLSFVFTVQVIVLIHGFMILGLEELIQWLQAELCSDLVWYTTFFFDDIGKRDKILNKTFIRLQPEFNLKKLCIEHRQILHFMPETRN